MPKVAPGDAGILRDPAPNFPTPAEIDLADELRHRLEEHYLHESAVTTPAPPPRSTDVH